MVLIRSRTLASPSAAIFSGVSASANRAGVALLTPASVACADSTTATRSVNGLRCSSSVRGAGAAAAKRRNASSISAGVHCGKAPCAAFTSALTRALGGLTCAALPLRAACNLFPGCFASLVLAGLALLVGFLADFFARLDFLRAMEDTKWSAYNNRHGY